MRSKGLSLLRRKRLIRKPVWGPSDAECRRDSAAFLLAAGSLALVFALGTAIQTVYVYHYWVPSDGQNGLIWERIVTNVVSLGIAVGFLSVMLLTRWGVTLHQWWRARTLVIIAAVCAFSGVSRVTLQVVLGIYPNPALSTVLTEFALTVGLLLTAVGFGFALSSARRRAREEERENIAQRRSADLALQSLQSEEIRVKREVAEGLHGTLQQHLVLISAQLRDIARRAEFGLTPSVVELASLDRQLDDIREKDVRQLSRLLYPPMLEVGIVPSVRALLARLPGSVSVTFTASAAFRSLDDPEHNAFPLPIRAMAVRIVEEGITNSLSHGMADAVAVRVDVVGAGGDRHAELILADNGVGVTRLPDPSAGGGLMLLRRRAEAFGGRLTLRSRAGGGIELHLHLPIATVGHDPDGCVAGAAGPVGIPVGSGTTGVPPR